MKCVHTSNSRLIKHPYTTRPWRAADASSKLTNKGTGAIPLRRLWSPFAPLEDSLRRGERPRPPLRVGARGSDEGTYRRGQSCNQKLFRKNCYQPLAQPRTS